MLLSQTLEEGYQRYLTELELARGQRINGLRVLSDGKVEVLCDHLVFTISIVRLPYCVLKIMEFCCK